MKNKVPLNKKTKTTVRTEDGLTKVRYHQTDVVQFNDEKIILNNGGWQTKTTKDRINQASNDYGLGIAVCQRNFEWFIMLRNPEYNGTENKYWLDDEIPFENGMVLYRTHFGRKVVPFLPIVGIEVVR